MSNFQVLKDNVFNSLTVTTNLKVPRYNGLPVDEPGKSGNIILNIQDNIFIFNIQDNIFYGHDGFTWVPFGGTGTELIVARSFFGPSLASVPTSPATSSVADIIPLAINAWQFDNFTTPVFGTSPDIFPDFINPYISFPSLTGTDVVLTDGVFEIDFRVGTTYNPTTSPTVIYPSIYVHDITNNVFVAKAYDQIIIPVSNPPFSSRSTLHARTIVVVPTTSTYRFYYGRFDPNTVNPTSIFQNVNPADTYVSVKRLCDV